MKAYEKYKITGIEWFSEIPDSWKVLRLKRLINPYKYYQIGDGDHGSIKPEMYQESGIPYFRVQNLSWDGKLDLDGIAFISQKVHNENLKSRLLPGDILIAKTGATIGKLAYLDDSIEEGNTTSSVAKITIDKRNFEPKFFLYYFQLPEFKDQIWIDALQKSAQPGFNVDDLVDYSAPVPPLPEQRQIAAYLDYKTTQIDRFITNRKKQIELLEEQKKAIINKAVTKGIDPKVKLKPSGVNWIGDIPEHWRTSKLTGVCRCVRGNSSFKKDELLSNGAYAALQYGKTYKVNVVDEYFEFYVNEEFYKDSQIVNNGDTIIISTSETIEDLGHSAFYNRLDLGLIGGEQMLLKPNSKKVHEKYLYYSSKVFRRELQKYGTGVKVFRFNINELKSIHSSIPPIQEQKQISDYIDSELSERNELISKYQKQIDLMQEYKTSLISKAVTGKIDVREWQPKQTLKETV